MTTPPRPQYSRGSVVLVDYPNSDLLTSKRRPALIIQADRLQTGIAQVIVAQITTNLTRAGHPSRVRIRPTTRVGRSSGLAAESVVRTDNLATVVESAIARVIGSVPMADIDRALRHTLGL